MSRFDGKVGIITGAASPDFSRGYLTRRPAPMILAVDGV